MQEVIINIGVSGSGKTTWSTNFIKKNPNYIRINRDDIRKTLRGNLDEYYKLKNLKDLEELVTLIESTYFFDAIQKEFNIIIDNTNLKKDYIDRWLGHIKTWEALKDCDIKVSFKIFNESDPKVLKKRVDVRDAIIDPKQLDYIDKQILSLKSIISYVENNFKNQIINE